MIWEEDEVEIKGDSGIGTDSVLILARCVKYSITGKKIRKKDQAMEFTRALMP
jgi:hypothetical protein